MTAWIVTIALVTWFVFLRENRPALIRRQFWDDFCLRVHFTSVWNSQAIKQAQKARSYFVWKQQKNFSVGFCVAHSWLLYKMQCPIKLPSANHRSLSWHSQVCKLWCICLIAGKTAQTFHCIGDWLAQCPRWALWPDAIVTDFLSLLAGKRFRCALQPRACRWLMSHCVQAALYVTARHAQLFIKLIWLLLLELWSNYTLVELWEAVIKDNWNFSWHLPSQQYQSASSITGPHILEKRPKNAAESRSHKEWIWGRGQRLVACG